MGSSGGHDSNSHGHGPQPKSQREKAFCVSKFLTFWWLNPLLQRGFKKPLQESDLEELISLNGLGIEETTEKLEKNWTDQLITYKRSGQRAKEPSLLKALFRSIGLYYALLMIPAIIVDGLAIAQPLFLKKLISYFSKNTTISERDAYLYAMAYSLCTVISIFFSTPYYYHRKMVGLLAKEGLIHLIYKKILRLSPTNYTKVQRINVGNLVASDVAKIEASFLYLHYLILGPVEAIVVWYLVWEQISYSSFVGMGILLVLVPLQVKMSSFIMFLRRKALESIDHRTQLIREIITGIRVVKMYVSEDLVVQLVGDIRRAEISWLKILSRGRSLFISLFFCSSTLVCFLTFMTYVLTGNALTSSKVFTCVALFNSVKTALTLNFPSAMATLSDMRVSLTRIQNFLMLEELCPICKGLEISTEKPETGECGIFAENITASWSDDPNRPTLRGMSFSIKQNEILSVIGEVGSGKSSMLQAILGELPLLEGKIKVNGRMAYAAQQSWVYNGTVRENVIFGKNYDEQRYNEVIKVCALERDLTLFQHGDMTLVGERGVALSGGQRARIGLARAVYSDADIYLLDDPLSAVDVHVGKHMYKKCILEYLSTKARILVTHQFRYVKQSDQIIAVAEGEIVARGSFTDIRRSGIDLISMCPLKTQEEEDEMNDIIKSVKRNDVTPRHRLSIASTQSSRLQDLLHDQIKSHRVAEILEDNEGESGTLQVPVFEEDHGNEEEIHRGAVALSTYVTYFRSLHSVGAAVFILFMFVLAQALYMLADWWLSYWVNEEEEFQSKSTTPDRDLYLGVYGGFTFGLLIVTLARTVIFYTLCLFMSCRLHTTMFYSLLRAPTYFFDVNSLGRILNRFSKDTNYIDESLPVSLIDFMSTALMTLGVIILVGAKSPLTFAIVLPLLIFFIIERMFYIRTARDLKRLDGVSRSPLFGHFATTFFGLDTIRAFNAKEDFFHQFHHYLDANTRCLFGYICVSSWLTFRLEVISGIFVSFVALISPVLQSSLSAATVGLILTYCTKLSVYLAKSIKKSTEVENMMTAVERIEEYCKIEPEAPTETNVKPPEGWPDKGEIVIRNLFYSYHKSKPPVLHDINLDIKSGEKIGIVGRSGAGKSSLLSILFRMAEFTGTCKIDGIDIKELGLKDLRRGISIIPQEPHVFSSTLRKNIDPGECKDDAFLWSVLEQVQLKSYVESLPNKLDTTVSAVGLQFSVGQRQLICLARAILCHTKILVIDEATANVDSKTSKIIWDTINERFKDCTVLTIAHRLFPVMQSDRIVVLDAGRIRELDSPHRLLQNPSSYLAHVVKDTGPYEENKLREVAKASYLEKQKPGSTSHQRENEKLLEEKQEELQESKKNDGQANEGYSVEDNAENKNAINLADIPQIRIESDTTCDTMF